MVDASIDADSPPLAHRLTEAFNRVRYTWEVASLSEREAFISWLCID
jgi:hypothetical protein